MKSMFVLVLAYLSGILGKQPTNVDTSENLPFKEKVQPCLVAMTQPAKKLWPGQVIINLPYYGGLIELSLIQNVDLLSASYTESSLQSSSSGPSTQTKHGDHCHYHGAVLDEPLSSVAMSLCQGVHGRIISSHGDLEIQPASVTSSSWTDSLQSDHLIWKRTDNPDVQGSCDTAEQEELKVIKVEGGVTKSGGGSAHGQGQAQGQPAATGEGGSDSTGDSARTASFASLVRAKANDNDIQLKAKTQHTATTATTATATAAAARRVLKASANPTIEMLILNGPKYFEPFFTTNCNVTCALAKMHRNSLQIANEMSRILKSFTPPIGLLVTGQHDVFDLRIGLNNMTRFKTKDTEGNMQVKCLTAGTKGEDHHRIDSGKYANLTTKAECGEACKKITACTAFDFIQGEACNFYRVRDAVNSDTHSTYCALGGYDEYFGDEVLSAVMKYRNDRYDTLGHHDSALFLTGRNLLRGSIGVAPLGGMCDQVDDKCCVEGECNLAEPLEDDCYTLYDEINGTVVERTACCGHAAKKSVVVVLATSYESLVSTERGSKVETVVPTIPGVGITATHEMGHSLGIYHDGARNSCPPSGFLMQAVSLGDVVADRWSECSVSYFANRSKATCLYEQVAVSECGNLVVEEGEECDVDDPCCEECSMKGSCLANEGTCCDTTTCNYKPDTHVCQEGDGLCVADSVCNGQDAFCRPNNVDYGTTCTDSGDIGACWEGVCVNYLHQCQTISANYNGHDERQFSSMCWKELTDPKTKVGTFDCEPSAEQGVQCRGTVCTRAFGFPNSGGVMGFPCGKLIGNKWSKVCTGDPSRMGQPNNPRVCLPLAEALALHPLAANHPCIGATCGEHGVCHEGECDCVYGYKGDNCELKDKCQNGQKDSGETDVDCGGPCLKCGDGLACTASDDDGCVEGSKCEEGVCVPSVKPDSIECNSRTQQLNISLGICECKPSFAGTYHGKLTCQYTYEEWVSACGSQGVDNACYRNATYKCVDVLYGLDEGQQVNGTYCQGAGLSRGESTKSCQCSEVPGKEQGPGGNGGNQTGNKDANDKNAKQTSSATLPHFHHSAHVPVLVSTVLAACML